MQHPCPVKKPAFFIGKYVALGYGAEIRPLGKVADSAVTLREDNVVQAITRFLARSLASSTAEGASFWGER